MSCRSTERSLSNDIYSQDDRDGSFNAYDPFTLNRLGTSAIAPPSLPNAKPNPKHRLTRLFDPDAEVHLWNQPGLGWSWDMEWEETRYVWTREVGNLLTGERGFTLSAVSQPAAFRGRDSDETDIQTPFPVAQTGSEFPDPAVPPTPERRQHRDPRSQCRGKSLGHSSYTLRAP